MHVILTHENADFDAIASLLGAHKLYPDGTPVLPERINSNADTFISLYRSALPFVPRAHWRRHTISRVTLVDTQRLPSLRGLKSNTPTLVIDHHPPQPEALPMEGSRIEAVGATVTLIIEQMAAADIPLTTLETTLLALGLYEDTGAFMFGRTTTRDLQAGAWLVARGADLDVVRRFLDVPLNDEQQRLFEQLLIAAETHVIEGYTIVVSTVSITTNMAEISRVVHRLSDTLDPAAVLIVVETPRGTHLICRSATDDIDVAAIARSFGGGGHTRAAAATLDGKPDLTTLKTALWEKIRLETHPAIRVAQLMSLGAQTVDAHRKVRDVVAQLRRIGHEGYPVVENEQVVGLLTRRDADRASEHGLGDLLVRDIMHSGSTTLTPDDSIYTLEQTMLQSGWGQIPVVDARKRLIGIVTRTDLIKHWAQTHPRYSDTVPMVDSAQIKQVLGKNAARIIHAVGDAALAQGCTVYMVGGCVRDLLLRRRNLDIDFVVEGDGIAFAQAVQSQLGGRLSCHREFGTAKWSPDETTHGKLHLAREEVPQHIDFVSARNEVYEHPTALPTVYSSSIKLDLLRRDFTINTLALQISPKFGRILDHYGGLHDLETRQLRVLHSLSFIDDPTRILRAIRFQYRLGFQIEPRTAALIGLALPMLGRITGERLRNELTLLFLEDKPEAALLELERRGALSAIHPSFRMPEKMADHFRAARTDKHLPIPDIYWHLLATTMSASDAESFCQRLMFGRETHQTIVETAQLARETEFLEAVDVRPSSVTARLSQYSEIALKTHRLISESAVTRSHITSYLEVWRHLRPSTNGHLLKAMGLPPGPCYKHLLERLRAARLDREVRSDSEEMLLLQSLLSEGFCDEHV
jgi:tRNA nucleotidyltransferase (CCA-adding enzyme)